MNIQDYISSGVIESYVLGELSDIERTELENLATQYPQVKTEIESVETALMQFASIKPPAHLKQSILSKLDIKETKVISLDTKRRPSTFLLVAASLVLLIGSAAYNIYLNNRLQNSQEQIATLTSDKEEYVKELQKQSSSYEAMAMEMDIVTRPENKKIVLKGLDAAPSALASIYWNPQTEDVYMHIKSLPTPSSDKQYQLWAIVDGKPVDAGVFDMITGSIALQKMKSIEGAQAFAVTLEKKGGSATPTLTAMYLLGNV